MSHQLSMKDLQRYEAPVEALESLAVAAIAAGLYAVIAAHFNVAPTWVELVGTWLTISCVYLVARDNIYNWPIGIVSVLFFAYAFHTQKLYSSMFLNVGFYFPIQFYGWWLWSKGTIIDNLKPIKGMNTGEWIVTIACVAFGALVWGMFFTTYTDAVYAQLDALILGLSICAQVLMNGKRVESWMLWICVNITSTYVYFATGLYMIAALYFCFIFLASYGLWNWHGQKIQTSEKQA
jgi:nicotinamide mononucleotide transporter